MAEIAYPDCFGENEYGVSGDVDSCPECGSSDYFRTGNRSGQDTKLVNLQCNVCGQNYDIAESYLEDGD